MYVTKEELKNLSPEELGELAMRAITKGDVRVEGAATRQGYVTIAGDDGVKQVPFTEAETAYYAPGSIEAGIGTVPIRQRVYDIPVAFNTDRKVQRTASARLDSMTKRLVDEWKRGGVTDATLREIAGEFWKAGTPISETELRQVAARFLHEAEQRQKAKQAKRVAEQVVR
jgi:hypothetical protein